MTPKQLRGLYWAVVISLALLFSSAHASININVDAVQKSIVFLYAADASGAVDSNKPIGTGFFVGIPLKSNPKLSYVVLVTARHMLDQLWAKCPVTSNPPAIYVRLNTKDYKAGSGKSGVGFVRIDLTKDGQPIWHHHYDDDVDAAVVPIPQIKTTEFSSFDINEIEVSDFPTDAEIASESIGDPAMSAGLLPTLPGKFRNYPIFKFGQISSIPSEDIETHCDQLSPSFLVKVWLIAANLVPGNSGSPIFQVPFGAGGLSFGGRAVLLGVQSLEFIGADVAGMTPIKYVWEILQDFGFPDADFHRGPQPPAPQPPAKPAPQPPAK